MRIIDEEGWQREEIEKKMEDFEKNLKIIKSDYGVLRDVEWQTEYILNRKRTILESIAIINCLENDFEYGGYWTLTIGYKAHENILNIMRMLKDRLLEIGSSLENVYIELIQCQQWTEDQKESLEIEHPSELNEDE